MATRISVLATYTPTPCGIATFTEALTIHLRQAGADVGVVRMVDDLQAQDPPVIHQWISRDQAASSDAAAAMNDYDVAVIQHEYGIFGGPDGEDVLDLVSDLRVPLVTVLHTVLVDPTANQRRVLAELCAASAALVTMTETARGRLIDGWGVHPSRVSVITHGAADNRTDPLDNRPALGLRPTILTWGLLSNGKGIEWALRAFAQLRDIQPVPRYRIVGQTHPRVLEREGEAYRDLLVGLIRTEVERAVARLGLVGADELATVSQLVGRLQSQLDAAIAFGGRQDTSDRTPDAATPAAKKAPAKKVAVKKAPAKKAPAKKVAVKKVAVKKAPAKKVAVKKVAVKKAPAKVVAVDRAPVEQAAPIVHTSPVEPAAPVEAIVLNEPQIVQLPAAESAGADQ